MKDEDSEIAQEFGMCALDTQRLQAIAKDSLSTGSNGGLR
jgi:hypothetical protein